MEILEIIIIITFSAVTALYWGAFLSLRLPHLHRCLDRKPFNCRPCLTFHLSWLLTTVFAVAASSLLLFICGIVAAFIVFLIVRYIDNKKITE